TPQKQAKHPNRPSNATNTQHRSTPGGGSRTRRISGLSEQKLRKHEYANERAQRCSARRAPNQTQRARPAPATRHPYRQTKHHKQKRQVTKSKSRDDPRHPSNKTSSRNFLKHHKKKPRYSH